MAVTSSGWGGEFSFPSSGMEEDGWDTTWIFWFAICYEGTDLSITVGYIGIPCKTSFVGISLVEIGDLEGGFLKFSFIRGCFSIYSSENLFFSST